MTWKRLVQGWKQYKYRFVPWIALNLQNRSVRRVPKGSSDKLVSDVEVDDVLRTLFRRFHDNQLDCSKQSQDDSDELKTQVPQDRNVGCSHTEELMMNISESNSAIEKSPPKNTHVRESIENITSQDLSPDVKVNPAHDKLIYSTQEKHHKEKVDSLDEILSHQQRQQYGDETTALRNLGVMDEVLGFIIQRGPSVLTSGGRGVVVSKGSIPQGSVLAMYPGAVYLPSEPVLFQSLGNPFIFRCIDSILIDGNDKGLSKFVYRSCSQRDRVGPYFSCDMSWLTEHTANPLAVGQYINNHNKEYPANVAYQEFDVPESFPFELRQFIPNIYYSPNMVWDNQRLMRTVVLVSTREISEGEELFSSYFTVVH